MSLSYFLRQLCLQKARFAVAGIRSKMNALVSDEFVITSGFVFRWFLFEKNIKLILINAFQ